MNKSGQMNNLLAEYDLRKAGAGFVRVFNTYRVELQRRQCAFHFRRRCQPIGHPPSVAVPQPNRCTFARLLNGILLTNRYSFDGGEFVQFNLPQGHHVVEWDVPRGVSIVFSMPHLLGFEESVSLSTTVNLAISNLAIDKAFFHIATGPGIVAFECHGNPDIAMAADDIPSFSSSRLVAWTKGSQFYLVGSKKVRDIYLSYLYLAAKNTSGVVLDADMGKNHETSSLWHEPVSQPLEY